MPRLMSRVRVPFPALNPADAGLFFGGVASPAFGGQEWSKILNMNFVYVIKSRKDLKRYIGLTNNLDSRIAFHNSGKVTATKNRRPFDLVYFEKIEDRIIAVKREKFLKSGQGREYLNSLLK